MTPIASRSTLILFPAVLVLAGAGNDAAAAQALVRGMIVDRANGAAIAGARVSVDELRAVVTGPDGRFEFRDLAVGRYLMRFVGSGYADRVDTLTVMRPGSIDLRVALTPSPYELDPIDVATRPNRPSPFLARMGFYDRREAGLGGTFFDRAAIERRTLASFTELFREVPGAVVRTQSMGHHLIRFNRATGGRGDHPDGCVPDLYVDGLITGGRPGDPKLSDHDLVVDPWVIEAVEVYVGANTPMQYRSTCGVILVWTRHR